MGNLQTTVLELDNHEEVHAPTVPFLDPLKEFFNFLFEHTADNDRGRSMARLGHGHNLRPLRVACHRDEVCWWPEANNDCHRLVCQFRLIGRASWYSGRKDSPNVSTKIFCISGGPNVGNTRLAGVLLRVADGGGGAVSLIQTGGQRGPTGDLSQLAWCMKR